jgi:phosphatidate cytidylyltransferase
MNLLKRIATSVILLPLVFVSIQYLPRLGFFCVIQIFILASILEFYNLPRKKKLFPVKTVGVFFALLISAAFYFERFPLQLAVFIGLFFMGVYYLLTIKDIEKLVQFPASIALTFFGGFYLSFTLNHFIPLRDEYGPYGPYYIYYILAVIFIGDTGAFLIGKKWGKHKLAPLASPKKTWEGCFAGLFTAMLTGAAAQQLFLRDQMSLWQGIIFAFLVHAVAQMSDPIESLFKRAAGVKDSSNLLPGHGGFFDRIDSLILAVPFFYYFLKYFRINL